MRKRQLLDQVLDQNPWEERERGSSVVLPRLAMKSSSKKFARDAWQILDPCTDIWGVTPEGKGDHVRFAQCTRAEICWTFNSERQQREAHMSANAVR